MVDGNDKWLIDTDKEECEKRRGKTLKPKMLYDERDFPHPEIALRLEG